MRCVAGSILLLALTASCAAQRRPRPSPLVDRCELSVYNRTAHALDIRVGHWLTNHSIGALNTGESLTHSVSCTEQRIWIAGVAIPEFVGAPTRFHWVQDWVDVIPGERANLSLHWP